MRDSSKEKRRNKVPRKILTIFIFPFSLIFSINSFLASLLTFFFTSNASALGGDYKVKTVAIKRPEEFTNIFFSTPAFHMKDIIFSTKNSIWVISENQSIEVEIDDMMISEPVASGNEIVFCSLHSKIIRFGTLGVNEEIETNFPCITPPLITNEGIYSVDMLGNFCLFYSENGERKRRCVRISGEDGFGTATFTINSSPYINTYRGYILVPYLNRVVAFSKDLRVRYPLFEFDNFDFITSFKVVGSLAMLSTQNKVYLYSLWKKEEAVFPELIFSHNVEGISGGDFDGEKIVITTKDGILLINKNGKGVMKKISEILDISQPKISGDMIFFTASFGRRVGKVFGPKKNSLVIAKVISDSTGKPKISKMKEIIIDGFANNIGIKGNKIGLLTENGTLYIFKVIKF